MRTGIAANARRLTGLALAQWAHARGRNCLVRILGIDKLWADWRQQRPAQPAQGPQGSSCLIKDLLR